MAFLDVWRTCLSDVVGFYFLELAANYKPEADLESFLSAGPPPVYIGFVNFYSCLIPHCDGYSLSFGSVTVEDPVNMTSNPLFKKLFDILYSSPSQIYRNCFCRCGKCWSEGPRFRGMGWSWGHFYTQRRVHSWKCPSRLAFHQSLCSLSPWWRGDNCHWSPYG